MSRLIIPFARKVKRSFDEVVLRKEVVNALHYKSVDGEKGHWDMTSSHKGLLATGVYCCCVPVLYAKEDERVLAMRAWHIFSPDSFDPSFDVEEFSKSYPEASISCEVNYRQFSTGSGLSASNIHILGAINSKFVDMGVMPEIRAMSSDSVAITPQSSSSNIVLDGEEEAGWRDILDRSSLSRESGRSV